MLTKLPKSKFSLENVGPEATREKITRKSKHIDVEGILEAISVSSWGTWGAFRSHVGPLGTNLSQHKAILTNVQKKFFVQQTCFCTNILFRTNMFFVHTTFVWQTFVVQTTCCTKYFLCKNNVQDCFFVYKEITLFFWWPKLFKLHICIVCDCLALNVFLKSAIAEAVHKRLRTGFGALC